MSSGPQPPAAQPRRPDARTSILRPASLSRIARLRRRCRGRAAVDTETCRAVRTAGPGLLWFLALPLAHPLTHTHSPSRIRRSAAAQGASVCEVRAGSCEESHVVGAEGRLRVAAAHHTVVEFRRGREGTGRQGRAGLRPQRETGASRKLGDGRAGARVASTNHLFPPRAQQEGPGRRLSQSGTGGVFWVASQCHPGHTSHGSAHCRY